MSGVNDVSGPEGLQRLLDNPGCKCIAIESFPDRQEYIQSCSDFPPHSRILMHHARFFKNISEFQRQMSGMKRVFVIEFVHQCNLMQPTCRGGTSRSVYKKIRCCSSHPNTLPSGHLDHKENRLSRKKVTYVTVAKILGVVEHYKQKPINLVRKRCC